MQYLTVRGLHKSFAHKTVFEALDLTVVAGQRVALVAGNGAGKTTLFRCLMGDLSFPEGTVEWYDKISVGMLTQDVKLEPRLKVMDALFDEDNAKAKLIKRYEEVIGQEDMDTDEYERLVEEIDRVDAWSYEADVRMVIAQLQLKDHLEKEIGVLSGGEKKRVALARLLIDEPDFLLLDEPTNHLDVMMIEWLESYILRHEFTVLMVTHDRYFLEAVCTDIYELEAGEIFRYAGNYSAFLRAKAARDAREAKELHDMKQLYRKELEWMRTAPRARESKSVYREKNFYDLEGEYKGARKKMKMKVQGLELSIKERRLGGKIMKVEKMSKSYGDQMIVDGFNYEFQQGERIGIVGPNGVGKSTFIRLLLGEEVLDAGHIVTGKTVVFGHYTQEHVDFDESKKVLEIVRDVAEFIVIADGSKLSATRLLERFMFPPKQQHSFVRFLSGGEKRRLALLLILLRQPNFLVLDEPTNDLDVQTIQVLEEFLLAYGGCLMVISHDRFFMDKIVDHLFVFEGEGQIADFWGSYTEYREQKNGGEINNEKGEMLRNVEKDEMESGGDDVHRQSKLSYLEQREFDRLGEEMMMLEEKKDAINVQFQDGSLSFDVIKKLGVEMKDVVGKLEEKEARWLALLGKVE